MSKPPAPTRANRSEALAAWVAEVARLTKPAHRIVWCDGSTEERDRLTEQAVAAGIRIPLNQKKTTRLPSPSLEPQRCRAYRRRDFYLHSVPRGRRGY